MTETKSTWSLYMVRCGDQSLYTGISNDVPKRFESHCAQGKHCAKYLRGRSPLSLVFVSEVGDHGKAASAEHKVKRLCKQDKERLVRGHISLQQAIHG